MSQAAKTAGVPRMTLDDRINKLDPAKMLKVGRPQDKSNSGRGYCEVPVHVRRVSVLDENALRLGGGVASPARSGYGKDGRTE